MLWCLNSWYVLSDVPSIVDATYTFTLNENDMGQCLTWQPSYDMFRFILNSWNPLVKIAKHQLLGLLYQYWTMEIYFCNNCEQCILIRILCCLQTFKHVGLNFISIKSKGLVSTLLYNVDIMVYYRRSLVLGYMFNTYKGKQ